MSTVSEIQISRETPSEKGKARGHMPLRTAQSRFPLIRKLSWRLVWVVIPLALLAWMSREWFVAESAQQDVTISAPVIRGNLPITISAGGEVESALGLDLFSEVDGDTKIIDMLPSGTPVTKGLVVMRLDSAEISRRLANQEIRVMQAEALAKVAQGDLTIQENKSASDVAAAELALKLAELDQKKYLEGESQVEFNDLKGKIALAETDLQEAQDTLEHFIKLVKEGFRTPEQLRAKEQGVSRAEFYLERDREKLRVLEKFTFERKKVELAAKAEEAKRESVRARSSSAAFVVKAKTDLEAANVTAKLENVQLEKLRQQLEHCTVRAPQDGVVVYPDDNNKRIERGEMVHYKQLLFSLPDMSQMQVKAFAHESVVKKVYPGQITEIRVDAFSDSVMKGSVKNVSTFYDSLRHWIEGGVKDYATTITIDDHSSLSLKPGMTAEVKIKIAYLEDVLLVPLQAVAEKDDRHLCYVIGSDGVETRTVTIGESNREFVEIKDGLEKGEQVALNARARTNAKSSTQRFIEYQFTLLDKNDDGKVSKNETPEEYRPYFDKIDTNGDRFIDGTELHQVADYIE